MFSETLVTIIKAYCNSQCLCNLGVCNCTWIFPPSGPGNTVPEHAFSVSMDKPVDMYKPLMVWFGFAWDMEVGLGYGATQGV